MDMATKRASLGTAALTILRVTVGIVMVSHGWKKLTDMQATVDSFAGMGMPAPDVMVWFAVAGEFLGGLGLLVGALTPLAGLGVMAVMLTAILVVHAGNGLFAENGGFEYPLVLLMAAFYFVVRGAGPVSVDALVRRGRASRHTPEDRPEGRPREAHG